VDGGWWPRTRDLTVELSLLLAEVDAAGYPTVWAVNYHRAAWERPPAGIIVDGRNIRMSRFDRPADVAMISLADSSGHKSVDLVVIPADARPDIAERALELAGRQLDVRSADTILALAIADLAGAPVIAGAAITTAISAAG
jgi:hypothetical protein